MCNMKWETYDLRNNASRQHTDALWPGEGGSVSLKARTPCVVLERIGGGTRDAKISNMDGDGGANDVLPLPSCALKACFPSFASEFSSSYGGLRPPPNRWIRPLYLQMAFVSTVGFVVAPHFGRTVQRGRRSRQTL
jgi:hypothetical protein